MYIHSKRAYSAIKIENPLEDLPKPSNFERFAIYQQRHQSFDCFAQTAAILYLCSDNGYHLVDDLTCISVRDIQESNPNIILFEPHQAIELAHSKMHATGDTNFTEIITKLRSGFTITQSQSQNNTQYIPYQHNKYHNKRNTIGTFDNDIIINMTPYAAWDDINTQYDKNNTNNTNSTNSTNNDNILPVTEPFSQNKHVLHCSVPEHHTISDKVSHFNRLSSSSLS